MELVPALGPFAAPTNAPGRNAAVALTLAVHALLALLLIYGIRWQTQLPESVAVELVAAVPPAPTIEPPPEPVQKVEPKPEPEPRPEPAPSRPDIAVKEKEKPRPPPPKEAQRAKTDPFAEQLKHETEQLARKRATDVAAAELDKLKADQAAAAAARAVATWSEKIAGKIKSNIVRPPDMSGNPEAIYEIALLPDGSLVADPRLRKSTGNATLDAAIERAIRKSSPLPKPDDPSAFRRELVLKFRPLEN